MAVNIDEKRRQLSPIPSERCIFRVHDRLRKVNEDAYEPQVIAIGPYHHANVKPGLQPMEEHKLRYLNRLLERRNENDVRRYMAVMRYLEGEARKFYAEPISHINSDDFVEMMLLDSCFIVELLRKYVMKDLIDADDPIFKFDHIQLSLRRDLMLFENQLPFFILERFFEMTRISRREDEIMPMAAFYFSRSMVIQGDLYLIALGSGIRSEEIKHLLGLVHYCWCYPFQSILSGRQTTIVDERLIVKSITELKETGIKFKKFESRVLFDIRFNNGIIEIPPLTFDDGTESLLRNLIAYEQYLPARESSRQHFTNYRRLMDRFINSSKDVEILRHIGIIRNYLGDDEAVSTIVNKLGDNVTVSASFYNSYSRILNDVNNHCRRRRNVWMAKLRRDYFNTPWALISFVAAFVLLLLTMTQTVFTILSAV